MLELDTGNDSTTSVPPTGFQNSSDHAGFLLDHHHYLIQTTGYW